MASNHAEEVEVEEDEAPVKKGKKSRKSKGKKHMHNDTDNAEESNVPNPDMQQSVRNQPASEALGQPQNEMSADVHDQEMLPKAVAEAATAPAIDGAMNAARNRSSSLSSTDGSNTSSGASGRGVEKILRGIFVEPMVAVGTAAKDVGETAMKPVKQVTP